MRFLFPGYCDSVRTLRQAPVSCDLDLVSLFRRSLGELRVTCSIAKVWLLTGDYYLETLVKQHAEISLFVKHVADKQQFPVFLRRYGGHCHA